MKVLEPGVWGILATPFHEHDLSVDVVSIERLVRFYRDVGATGVVALGVLGEASRLSSAERGMVLRAVVGAAGGTPVVSGISALATSPAIEEARQAAIAGVQAVMVQVPTADPGTLEAHLTAISEASGLGIVVQDHPASTGVTIPAPVLARCGRRRRRGRGDKERGAADRPKRRRYKGALARHSRVRGPWWGVADRRAARGLGGRDDRLCGARGVGRNSSCVAVGRVRSRREVVQPVASIGGMRGS